MEPRAAFRIRRAMSDDATRLGRMHHAVWLMTYGKLAPAGTILILTESLRIQRWQQLLADEEEGEETWLAESDDTIAGFVTIGRPKAPLFGNRGAVRYLYVLRERQGQGLGRQLFAHAAERLSGMGYGGVALACVIGNTPAERFYQKLGGRVIGTFTDDGPVWRSLNQVFVWDDMSGLQDGPACFEARR